MKLVALDVGEKRIGVATADSSVKIAVPRGTVDVDGDELMMLAKIVQDEGAKHLIIGLPRNAQGEETAQSRAVRAFAAALQGYFVKQKMERPLVKFQDESLTSVMAEERLGSKKRKKRRQKADVDSEAATIILQDFLNSFGGEQSFPVEAKKKPKTKNKVKHKVFKVFAMVVGLLIVASIAAITWYKDMLRPVDPDNCQSERCETQSFVVLEGESVERVANSLETQGLIRSELAFRIFLKLERKESDLKAGVYTLNSGMETAEVARVLSEGSKVRSFKIEVLPGESLNRVKQTLIGIGYDRVAVDEAFARDYQHEFWGAGMKVENFLYAGSYDVGVDQKVEDFVQIMLGRLAGISVEYRVREKFAEIELDYWQGFDLAARVRVEVGGVSERAMKETARAAELIRAGDTNGKTGVAVDFYALMGTAYWESHLPFVSAGDYAGWLEVYGELAQEVGTKYGIPYEAILAQSILESSWGRSKLAYKYFNFFGIKYANMPKDPSVAPSGSVNMQTWEEYEPGVSTTIQADFAVWDSKSKGFHAYGAWITGQSRYKEALRYPHDPIRYIEELKRAGYATDANYVEILVKIIEALQAVKD
ncbi:Holliday junction resolvase RuvX [Candidatus Saccharibacteria bacterium]|nr:Holliday junction resolvase RuvX [Candidatus Saccharibacteria bacterium]